MKKIFVVRHGNYAATPTSEFDNEPLSDSGRFQLETLAPKLAQHINGDTVLMVASTALRALQSAEIISACLNIPFETNDLLWSGGGGKVSGYSRDFQQLLDELEARPRQPDILILVTHYEYVENFPEYFGHMKLGKRFNSDVINKGTAWLIDCEAKVLTHIR